MLSSEKTRIEAAAKVLYEQLKRPAAPIEFARVLGCSRDEALELLERATRARVLTYFERWVVRGHIMPRAWGPAGLRRRWAAMKRARIVEWIAEQGQVNASYGEIADAMEIGSFECHKMMQDLIKQGRIVMVAPRVFEVKRDARSEVCGDQRTG